MGTSISDGCVVTFMVIIKFENVCICANDRRCTPLENLLKTPYERPRKSNRSLEATKGLRIYHLFS